MEILKGVNSSVFGSNAVGGVISRETLMPNETFLDLFLELGSFDSEHRGIAGGVSEDVFGFVFNIDDLSTDNHLPNNRFERVERYYAARVNPTEKVEIGATFRDTESEFQNAGARNGFSRTFDTIDSELFTTYLQFQQGDFTSRFTYGNLDQDFRSTTPVPVQTYTQNEKETYYWDNVLENPLGVTRGGLAWEETRVFTNGTTPSGQQSQFGAYVSHDWEDFRERLRIGGSLRLDDYDTWGETTNYRFTGAYELVQDKPLRPIGFLPSHPPLNQIR